MGFELLTQPQVFTTRLTAIGGIEGYVPPFISKFHTWTINTTVDGTTFDIPQDFVGLTHAPEEAFLVNINGSIIPPTDFAVNVDFRRITFFSVIPANTRINITQIGTVEMLTATFVELTGLKFFSKDADIVSLSSAEATITDLTVGQINGTLNVNGPIVTSGTLTSGPITTDRITVNANTSNNAVGIFQAGTGNAFYAQGSNAVPFVINNQGQVGVGTTTPGEALQIAGNLRVGGSDSSYIAFRGTTGDGPGTFNHSYIGERIYGPDTLTERSELLLYKGNDSATQVGPDRIRFTAPSLVFQTYPTTLNTAGAFETVATNPGVNNTRMVINPDGKVGIGIEEPEALLHVHGTVSDILQTATGSDSPVLIQQLTNSFIDAKCGIEIIDNTNSLIVPGGNSHTMYFNRDLPGRAVHYWYTSSPSPTSIFALPGSVTLTNQSQNYIVAVGGLIQPFTRYAINTTARTITFTTATVPASASVYVLQLVNPSLAAGYNMTAVSQVTGFVSQAQPTVSLSSTWPNISLQSNYLVSYDGITQVQTSGTPVYIVNTTTDTLTFQGTVPVPSRLVTVAVIPSANPNSGEWTDACFVATNYNWTFVTTTDTTNYVFVDGPVDLLTEPECYIVNIGGVLQAPFSYSINVPERRINFSQTIPSGIVVSITQLAQPQLPIVYTTTVNIVDDCSNNSSGNAEKVAEFRPGQFAVQGGIATAPPISVTSTTYTVPFSASSIVFNTAGTTAVSLPRAWKYPGRWLYMKSIQARLVNSDASNVVPIATGTAGTAIISPATAGRWAQLQSDGTNWVVMAQGGA